MNNVSLRALLSCALLAGTAACGGGSGGSAPPPPPPPPAPVHDIVFDGTDATGTRRLYRVAAEGGTPALLGAGYDGVRPHARADGRAVAYATLATDVEPSQLMVVDDFTRAPVAVSAAGIGEREPVWSPDGTRIAYHSQRDDADGDVFVATYNATARRLENVRNLTPRGAGEPAISPDVTPAWSPDGTRIAFTSYRGGSAALWVMNADGTQLRQLTPTSPTHGDYFPSWSPDGTRIAFQRINTTIARIGIVPAAGGNAAFFDFDGQAFAPAWSPDGRWIAFTGRIGSEDDIHVREVDGTQVRRIARAGADRNPAWLRRATG